MNEEGNEEIKVGFNEKKDSLEKDKTFTDKMRENPWIVSTIVLGLLVIILLVGTFGGIGITGNVVSGDEAAQNLLDFYSSNGAQGLEIDSVEESNGLYKVNFLYQGAVVPIYMTRDGQLAGSMSLISPVDNSDSNNNTGNSASVEIPKSDKPEVELFVMTHCPYGTQAEKGSIPTIKALGDNINAKIRFVHYTMHGAVEDKETQRQVCIREEQSTKYLDYLECFLGTSSGKEEEAETCLTNAKIDKTKLNSCISSGKADEYYAEDSELSKGYGVQGSPTLVINGQIISSGRNSAAYLTTICNAFNNVPKECSTLELSSTNPSAGFGYGASGSGSTASCG